jgi:DNA repair protein RadC
MEKEQFWASLKSGEFASMVKESSKGERLLASRDVYHVMKPVFADQDDTERMYGIFLNCRNRVIAIEKLFEGTITQMAVYPRELIKRVLKLRATAVILVHNHPSGDPSPSREDKALTMKVAVITTGIEVSLHDHVIVGDGYYSMADSGDINTIMSRVNDLFSRGIGGI